MSRVGRAPVPLPEGVQVDVADGEITVRGPLATLHRILPPDMTVKVEERELRVERPSESREHRALHGLTRALVANMVEGVTGGFRKELEIEGVGYRAEMQGDALVLHLGFSHPVEVQPPDGVTFSVERGAKGLLIEGADKQAVSQAAAEIRAIRPPEPYKGKGIRYRGEQVRRKAGKAGKIGLGA